MAGPVGTQAVDRAAAVLTAVLGSTAGNKFTFTSTCMIRSLNYSDRNQVRVHSVNFDVVKTDIGTTNGNEFQLKMS